MGQIGAVQVRHSQLAEDVVKDRRRVLDRLVALHHARWFKLGEGEGVHKLLQRHTVLQAHGHSDGEVVHHRPEARTFLVHINEDLTQIAVFILAGAQVDLVAANDGFLGVALAPLGHLFTATGDFLDDDLLDHLLRQHNCLLVVGAGLQGFGGLVIVLNQGGCQWLRQLRSITVQRVGFHPQRPRKLICLLAILDCGVVGHVDRLGDRTRDKGLGGGHHVDMRIDAQVALALFPARVRAVEHGQVFVFEERRALQGHGPTDVIVCGVDISFGEAKMAQQIKCGIVQFCRWNTQSFGAEVRAEGPLVEDKADVEGRRQGRLDLLDLGWAKAVADQACVVDGGRLPDGAVTNCIGNYLFDLG